MITPSMFKFHASLFAGILTIASLTPASHGQASATLINVDVPFAFQNGSQHFAAGRYTISKTNQNILLVRGKSHSGFAGSRESPVTLTAYLRRQRSICKWLGTGPFPRAWRSLCWEYRITEHVTSSESTLRSLVSRGSN